MASKRITKELQVRVRAVRLGARLDRARVARRGGFPGSPRVARNERDGEACRVSRRLGNAPRTSPRPSPRGQDRANRLTTIIRLFPARNRISKRIPRRPAAPGRGRTMTFSTGTPPSSDLRTRPTRVAFSSWPFTCVSPPAQQDTPGVNATWSARARARLKPRRAIGAVLGLTSPRRGSGGSPRLSFFASDLARRRVVMRHRGADVARACFFFHAPRGAFHDRP